MLLLHSPAYDIEMSSSQKLGKTVLWFVKSQTLQTRGLGLFSFVFNWFSLLQLSKFMCRGLFVWRLFQERILLENYYKTSTNIQKGATGEILCFTCTKFC